MGKNETMLTKENMVSSTPHPLLLQEGAEKFSVLAKKGGGVLALFEFLVGEWVKIGWDFFRKGGRGWGFSESNFQQLIKDLIIITWFTFLQFLNVSNL